MNAPGRPAGDFLDHLAVAEAHGQPIGAELVDQHVHAGLAAVEHPGLAIRRAQFTALPHRRRSG